MLSANDIRNANAVGHDSALACDSTDGPVLLCFSIAQESEIGSMLIIHVMVDSPMIYAIARLRSYICLRAVCMSQELALSAHLLMWRC